MDFNDVFSNLGSIITLLIVLIFSIYLWSMIIRAIPVVVKFLLKVAYVLALIGATVFGTGYVLYSILLFVNGQPVNLAFVLTALFCVFMGGMGMINMLRNNVKPSQIRSAPRYPNRANNPYGFYTDPSIEEEEARKQEKINLQKDFDEIDARYAKDWTDTLERQEKEAEINAYHQQVKDEWQQKQNEAEEYNRQERAKWTQQDE